jgi:GntR family transcriptional regulator
VVTTDMLASPSMSTHHDLTRPEHLSQQIAGRLRDAIDAGEYQPGDLLPSEWELARRYQVSRPTVRKALRVLRTEGLIAVEQGRGTFVRVQPVRLAFSRHARAARRPGFGLFESACATQGVTGYTEMILVQRRPADLAVATGLNVPVGTDVVCRRRHMHLTDPDRVIQIQEGYLLAEMVTGTDLARPAKVVDGIYPALERIGHGPARITEEVSARMADPTEILAFGSRIPMPVLELRRRTFDTAGTVVEWLIVVAAADQSVFVYDDLPLS